MEILDEMEIGGQIHIAEHSSFCDMVSIAFFDFHQAVEKKVQ